MVEMESAAGLSDGRVLDQRVLDQLRETVGGDDGFLEEVLRTYLTDGAGQLATMKRARASRDTSALGRAAHSLKSNSAGVGATRLGALCAALEARVRGGEPGQPVDAGGEIAAIESEFGRVARALERRLTSDDTAGVAGGAGR